MNWKARLLYSQNWNIGFVEQSVEDLLDKQQLGRIRWMKHKFKDRWFADPFIYKVTEDEIVVFVEECLISDTPKGIICELHVDKQTMKLRQRYVLLELKTHLSYPAIIDMNGKTYVYPENGASGNLKIYRYDEHNHKLDEPICILNDAVADSTILKNEDGYILIATKSENSQENAYLYNSQDLFGVYKIVSEDPVQKKRSCSRPAGNWIHLSERIYRPTQDCVNSYGGAINLMKVESMNPFCEKEVLSIKPTDYKYSLGIHTINFSKDSNLAVVDGCGFLHPVFARLWYGRVNVKLFFKRKKR